MSGSEADELSVESSVELDAVSVELDPSQFDTDELDLPFLPRAQLLRNTLLLRAQSWVGHEFGAAKKEQCANFIHQLLAECGIKVKPAVRPFDWNLTSGLAQGPAFANSFFSSNNGRLLGYGDLLPGDLVAFRDTYEGEFPLGCITHVGLWVADETMIDRSTAGDPVRQLVLDAWWKARFVVGLRPYPLC